jgi:hypothetical protein
LKLCVRSPSSLGRLPPRHSCDGCYPRRVTPTQQIRTRAPRAPKIVIRCAGCPASIRVGGAQRTNHEAGKPVYCSRACQHRAHHETVTCCNPDCGKLFEIEKYRLDKATTGKVFCSRSCGGQMGQKPRTGRHIPCGNDACAEQVWVIPALEATRRFCSVTCKDVWQARNQVTRSCDHCSAEYTRSASVIGRFCSKRCEGDYKTEHAEGSINADGYRVISAKGRNLLEHRAFAEQILGRPLLRTEEVHHGNGNRADNRTDGPFELNHRGQYVSGNLEIWSTRQPAGQEIGPKLDWAREMLGLYGDADEKARYGRLAAVS